MRLGRGQWLTEGASVRIHDFLCLGLPWRVTHIAWERVPNATSFDWGQSSDAQASEFFRGLAVCRHTEVAVLFSAQHALRVSTSWLADNLIEASCRAEQFVAVGGAAEDPDLSAVVEFATGRTIWGHAA